MCNPIALAATMLISSGMQAYSQYQSGKFNAEVANQNARLNEQSASDAINRGNVAAENQRSKTRQLMGSQTAAMAASGVDLGSTGSLDLLGDTAAMGELDALTLVNNSKREAYGYQMQARNERLNAKMSRWQGNMGAMNTLLTAPIKAYSVYRTAGGAWDLSSGNKK